MNKVGVLWKPYETWQAVGDEVGVGHRMSGGSNRRFLLALFLTSSLFCLFSDIASASNQLESAGKCTRIGSSKTVKNTKFSCVKTAGKLVWIAVRSKNTSSSKGTPTASASTGKIGTKCTQQGEEIKAVEKLVCRQIGDNQFKYFLTDEPAVAITNPTSPNSMTSCRLPDLRPQPVQPAGTSITYPLTPRPGSVKQGVQTIAVLGFDFSDAPGSGSPLDIFGNSLETAKSFFDWYSNGKVALNFRKYDKWIRLSGSANRFKTGEHFESESELSIEQMSREYYQAAKAYLELSDVSAIWFVYPKDMKQLQFNFGKSGGGFGLPAIYGFGPYRYSSTPLWGYFVHEMLHEQGLQGHSPKAPWIFGALLNDNGISLSLNSWDELVLDWMQESEVYCVEKASLSSVELELAPIERVQTGLHSVMIKISNHQVLVIESHRSGTFSPGMHPGIYGLTVQLVDTTRATSWDDDQATSVFLQTSKAHQKFPPYGVPVVNGRDEKSGISVWNGVGVNQAAFGIDMSYFLLEGETLVTNGVKIAFVKSGYTDRISLSISN